jgi:hypothetical protein
MAKRLLGEFARKPASLLAICYLVSAYDRVASERTGEASFGPSHDHNSRLCNRLCDRSAPFARAAVTFSGSVGAGMAPRAMQLPRISCARHSPSTSCAAFFTESHMRFGGGTKLHRRSGFGLQERSCRIDSKWRKAFTGHSKPKPINPDINRHTSYNSGCSLSNVAVYGKRCIPDATGRGRQNEIRRSRVLYLLLTRLPSRPCGLVTGGCPAPLLLSMQTRQESEDVTICVTLVI